MAHMQSGIPLISAIPQENQAHDRSKISIILCSQDTVVRHKLVAARAKRRYCKEEAMDLLQTFVIDAYGDCE